MTPALNLALAREVTFFPAAPQLFGYEPVLAVSRELEPLAVADVIILADGDPVHLIGVAPGVNVHDSPSSRVHTLLVDAHLGTIHRPLELHKAWGRRGDYRGVVGVGSRRDVYLGTVGLVTQPTLVH